MHKPKRFGKFLFVTVMIIAAANHVSAFPKTYACVTQVVLYEDELKAEGRPQVVPESQGGQPQP